MSTLIREVVRLSLRCRLGWHAWRWCDLGDLALLDERDLNAEICDRCGRVRLVGRVWL